MRTEIIVALIEVAPTVLGVALVVVLVVVFRNPLRKHLLPRVSGVKFMGLEISLKEKLDGVAASRDVHVSEGDKWSAITRAQHVAPVISGARILWVDDEPRRNEQLVKILVTLGSTVDQASDSEEALLLLRRHQYDVVISDIKRGDDNAAGLNMAKRMRDEGLYRWTVFYVSELEPGVPALAFNITDRPDHLLHFVMDVLERERWRP